ncbi:MAG: hypothetical protein KDK27_07545 [Leptospiraceae bacterium]|nr:hypothetical protein [Leptospiraceae bacterium]
MQTKPGYAVGLTLLLLTGCVTEEQHKPIAISGNQIYPAPRFIGVWEAPPDRIHFQLPPDPAYVEEHGDRRTAYDIVRMVENPQNYFLFELQPRGGGPIIQRFYHYRGDRLREQGGSQIRMWNRISE